MAIGPGSRVVHKTLGKATAKEYLNFDGTKEREKMLKDTGIIFIELDEPPPGWVKVVQVDMDALTELEE